MTDTPKKSDLPVRTASAIVMVAVAGTALWLGGWVWTLFVAAVALGVLWEWTRLFLAFTRSIAIRIIWGIVGATYVIVAAYALIASRGLLSDVPSEFLDRLSHPSVMALWPTLRILVSVAAVDVGAYFSGRKIGGPKIAPTISPSKTWSGLLGGILAAILVLVLFEWFYFRFIGGCHLEPCKSSLEGLIWIGSLTAILAQSGDFFESWMKRQAGVKDSGTLIPGHGGLFDRVDGLLAVAFAIGLLRLIL